jgi:adenylate cyclase
MKIFRQNNTYHAIAIDPESTVASMMAKLNKKFKLEDDNAQYNLYLKEQGRGELISSVTSQMRSSFFYASGVSGCACSLTSHLFLTERILGQSERPADIIKLRMKQAGYDVEDGAHLLGIESLGILVKFVYKSQLLAGVR